jgi:hypothetical protein
MQTGLQILGEPFRTKNLFSRHYLETNFKDPKFNPSWDKVGDESALAFKEIKELWIKKTKILGKLKESQLEDEFIRPVLKILGHIWDVQAIIPHAFGTFGTPDYAFFRDEETKNKVKQDKHVDYFKAAIGIGEAKAWDKNLDKRKKAKEKEERIIPSSQINTYLKVSDVKWGILTNGRIWRLYYRETSFNLDSYYEIDLPELLQFGSVEQFKYFFLLFRREAFALDQAGRCFLDDVYDRSIELAKELEENVKENVYEALRLLAYGFLEHPDNKLGLGKLKEIHDNCLILLYRLLFILYAEARGLLPVDNSVYASVSLHQLKRDVADALSSPTKVLLIDSSTYWSRLKTLFSWINEGSEKRKIPKEQLHIPPYNGGLFDPIKHSFLESNKIGDKYLAKGIELLTRASNSKAGVKGFIDYSTLSIRHLGSIYEGLLEYKVKIADQDLIPVLEKSGEVFIPLAEAQKQKKKIDETKVVHKGELYLVTDKGERKATGSYFTPDYIVKYIVENTLGPIVEEKKAHKNGKGLVENILSVKVLDPAMGSGHFLVEATTFLATRVLEAMQEVEEEVNEEQDIVWARRLVVERCIYGVDLNPLAIELAKVSLWLHTIAQDKALSFLDHHLKCGNSLIGAKIEEIAKGLPTAKAKSNYTLWGSHLKVTMEEALAKRMAIQFMPSDTTEQIKDKERILKESDELIRRSKQVADLYLSGYFGNGVSLDDYARVMGDIALIEEEWLKYEKKDWFKKAVELADEKRFFHWELEFPEVFMGGDELGEEEGFDAVVTNPPYSARLDNFDRKFAEIAFPTASADKNTAIQFIELCGNLVLPGGRCGLIVPKSLTFSGGWERSRSYLHKRISLLVDVSKAFEDVLLEQVVIVYSGTAKPYDTYLASIAVQDTISEPLEIHKSLWATTGNWLTGIGEQELKVLTRIARHCSTLGSISETFRGLPLQRVMKDSGEIPVFRGDDISRYRLFTPTKFVDGNNIQATEKRLERLKQPKIMSQNIVAHVLSPAPHIIIMSYYDEAGTLNLDTVNNTVITSEQYSPLFVLAVLNSRFVSWYTYMFIYNQAIRTMHFDAPYVGRIPLPPINFSMGNDERAKVVGRFRELYEEMLIASSPAEHFEKLLRHLRGTPTVPEVLHDFLVVLSRRMLDLNRHKQDQLVYFCNWLNDAFAIPTSLRQLELVIARGTKQSVLLFFGNIKQKGAKLSQDVYEQIKDSFQQCAEEVSQTLRESRITDKLIDSVVYYLYGLEESEIQTIEATFEINQTASTKGQMV